MKKVRWADMTDDDDLVVPVTISKHGIKIRAPTPPPPPIDKTIKGNDSNDEM
jgi:hypothetical protein